MAAWSESSLMTTRICFPSPAFLFSTPWPGVPSATASSSSQPPKISSTSNTPPPPHLSHSSAFQSPPASASVSNGPAAKRQLEPPQVPSRAFYRLKSNSPQTSHLRGFQYHRNSCLGPSH